MKWEIDHSSRTRLQDQIAGSVRRAVASGDLSIGEQLPPAAELALALSVDRNTVLAAYRQLRDDGILEFRRGRGARVTSRGPDASSLNEAVRNLINIARDQGLGTNDLIRILKEMT